MTFTKALFSAVVAVTLSLSTTMALALSTVSFDPSSSTGSVAGTVVVDLVWDGTGGVMPMYLGDFDVDIAYDDSIVTFLGGTIDPDLGVDSFGCFMPFDCDIDGSVPGTVNLFEFSFDSVPDLIANQDGLGNRFRLATFTFEGLFDGQTDLTLSGIFGDEFGGGVTPTLVNGDITIGTPAIPEPSTILLFGTGLAGLAAWRMRQQRVR